MAQQKRINQTALGTAMALTGVVAFSGKAVLVKLCYTYGASPVSVLLLRMLFALPIYIAIALYDHKKRKGNNKLQAKDATMIFLLGLLGYYLSSFLDFSGLLYIDASLERLVLFAYPTMVVIISRFLFKKTITKRQVLAIAVTYAGIVLAFADRIELRASNGTMIGTLLVFACAITYAFYLAGSGELIPRVGTVRFTAYAIIVSCIAVITHYCIFSDVELQTIPTEVYWLCFIMALFSTVLPSFLISEAISRIGAPNVSILGSAGPFSTIALAIIFLDEHITVFQIAGTVVVIGGIVLLNKKKLTS